MAGTCWDSVDSRVPSQTHSLWCGDSAIWSLCLGLRGSSPEPMLSKALHVTDTHTNSVNTQMLCHLESHSLPITLNSLDWDEHYSGPRDAPYISCPVPVKQQVSTSECHKVFGVHHCKLQCPMLLWCAGEICVADCLGKRKKNKLGCQILLR